MEPPDRSDEAMRKARETIVAYLAQLGEPRAPAEPETLLDALATLRKRCPDEFRRLTRAIELGFDEWQGNPDEAALCEIIADTGAWCREASDRDPALNKAIEQSERAQGLVEILRELDQGIEEWRILARSVRDTGPDAAVLVLTQSGWQLARPLVMAGRVTLEYLKVVLAKGMPVGPGRLWLPAAEAPGSLSGRWSHRQGESDPVGVEIQLPGAQVSVLVETQELVTDDQETLWRYVIKRIGDAGVKISVGLGDECQRMTGMRDLGPGEAAEFELEPPGLEGHTLYYRWHESGKDVQSRGMPLPFAKTAEEE